MQHRNEFRWSSADLAGPEFYVTMSVRLVEFSGYGLHVSMSVQPVAFTSFEFRFNGPADKLLSFGCYLLVIGP